MTVASVVGGGGCGDSCSGGWDGAVVVVVVSKIRRQQQFVSFHAVRVFTQGRFMTFLCVHRNKFSGPILHRAVVN